MIFPTIALDLDGVVVDFHQPVVDEFNRRYQESKTLKDFDFIEGLPPKVVDIFCEEGWFEALKPLPGSIATISKHLDLGHRVVICTAPTRANDGYISSFSAKEKFDWATHYIPALASDVIIARNKEMVSADILADDTPYNITRWCEKHPDGLGVLVDQPWNKSWDKLPENAIRADIADIATLIERFWCQKRGKLIYRLDELRLYHR